MPTDAPSRSALAIKSKFGTPRNLLALFNPGHQIRYTADIKRAYGGTAPSLGAISGAFGAGTSRTWLVIQLADLAEYSGSKTKLTTQAQDQLARLILDEYPYLRLSELMDFFKRFKLGEYGRFYGAVDPLAITEALREWLRFRFSTIEKIEAERARQAIQSDPQEIRWRDRVRAEARKRKFYSYNFRTSGMTYEEFSDIWWLFNLGYESADHGYINPF